MRVTSIIAGLLTLIVTIAALSWVIRPSPATQQPLSAGSGSDESSATPPTPPDQKPPEKRDEHESNPFTLSTEGDQPKAVVDEVKHNFGRLAVSATGRHDFMIRNEGTAPLKLAKGTTTCKCTGFSLGLLEIAPGASAPIHLEWEKHEPQKEFSQTATIWTNDPEHPKFELEVTGDVVPTLMVVPEGVWTIGALSENSTNTVKGYIAAYQVDSFEITGIETSADFVTVQATPLGEQMLKDSGALSGYELVCTVAPKMPAGNFRERVKVNLTIPDAPQVQFYVQGSRIGPFQVIGPGWTQSVNTLNMGRCKAAEGKKVQISLFATPPANGALEFGEPQVTPPLLKVSVRRDESFSTSGGRQRYHITFEAPPGVAAGRWQKDTAIQVVLPCNHPEVASLKLNVDFQAE